MYLLNVIIFRCYNYVYVIGSIIRFISLKVLVCMILVVF